MKIDEAGINHNALNLIKKETDVAFNINSDSRADVDLLIATIAKIDGIILMADVMKELLKA